MLFISNKIVKEVSNRYSVFLSVALAVSSTTCVISEEVDSKDKSLDEIAAAVEVVKDNGKIEEPTVPPQTTRSQLETVEESVKEVDAIDVQYSFHKEQLSEQFYKTAGLDYETLGYGPARGKLPAFESEDEYTLEVPHQEIESEMLTEEEAEDKMKKIEYATLFGNLLDVNFEERRQVSNWMMFNPSYAGIFKANALTQDVNYGSL